MPGQKNGALSRLTPQSFESRSIFDFSLFFPSYSKLLARFTDFADSHAAPESNPALPRTLGKLVIIDMASVIESLNTIPQTHTEVSTVAEKHIRNLQYVHHRVISLIGQIDKD